MVLKKSYRHCRVHDAFQKFQSPGVFPGFRICACCFHVVSMLFSKTIQEPCVGLDFCRTKVFEDVAVMLCSCCFPQRFKNLVFSKRLANAAFIICPRFFPKRSRTSVFPGFCACCFHVVSMLLSKMYREPGISQVFPRFCAYCFHVVSMLFSEAFQESRCFRRFLCALISYGVHAVFQNQNVSRTWCFLRFLHMIEHIV